jgi:hypothetical protein
MCGFVRAAGHGGRGGRATSQVGGGCLSCMFADFALASKHLLVMHGHGEAASCVRTTLQKPQLHWHVKYACSVCALVCLFRTEK